MMPQLATLPAYSPLNGLIPDLHNFTLVPHPSHCELIRKSQNNSASS